MSSASVNRRCSVSVWAGMGAWAAAGTGAWAEPGTGADGSPAFDVSRRRASSYRPASARCSTAATTLAASTLTVPPGRRTRAMAAIAAAGESTYSSTLWQTTRSAAPSPTSPAISFASPWTAVRVTPSSAARQRAAARASGLGSTTVT